MMMSRVDQQVQYNKVSSAEDESFEHGPCETDEESYYEGHLDELGGIEDEVNSLLAPSTMDPDDDDVVGFGSRGTAPRYRRIYSLGGERRPHSISFCRWRNGINCLLLGVLAMVAVTVSRVWSSRDGASKLLPLQFRCAATQPTPIANPDDDIKTLRPTASPSELLSEPRPDLHELIADFKSDVIGNVSWLVDFAILGHAKCSTTAHLFWLRSHPEILMHKHEVGALARGQPAEMVSLMYALPSLPHQKRGYKSPADIMAPRALKSLRTYWPDVKLIVGVRHPVKWFESYYNYFKLRAAKGKPTARLGPAETMGVPAHAYFHAHLSLLGKTNVTDPGEMALLGDRAGLGPPVPMKNKVFLYESTQPYDLPNGRDAQYRRDMQAFLELTEPLDPIPLHGEADGDTYNYSTPTYHYAIDICEDKYAKLRRQLVRVGSSASEWILTYFVPHPDVTVSSPERFEELLRSWSLDPCKTPRKR